MKRKKLIYPVDRDGFISAEVFEDYFIEHIGTIADIEVTDLKLWLKTFTSQKDVSSADFEAANNSYDYICTSKNMVFLLPALVKVRNESGSKSNFLIIAHAPALYGFVWFLLEKLLGDDDVIVAPTKCAAEIIEIFTPGLAKNIRIIHHPVSPASSNCPIGTASKGPFHLLYMGRICESKLIHRLIEAVKLLKEEKIKIKLTISGKNSTVDELDGNTRYLNYLNFLAQKWQIEDQVTFTGLLKGQDKDQLLATCDCVCNLSVTPEESFGKIVTEAISYGKPLIATAWNGLVETTGRAGELIKVMQIDHFFDIKEQDLCLSIKRIIYQGIDHEIIKAQASIFSIALCKDKYKKVLSGSKGAPVENHVCNHGVISNDLLLSTYPLAELLDINKEYLIHFCYNTSAHKVFVHDSIIHFINDAYSNKVSRFYSGERSVFIDCPNKQSALFPQGTRICHRFEKISADIADTDYIENMLLFLARRQLYDSMTVVLKNAQNKLQVNTYNFYLAKLHIKTKQLNEALRWCKILQQESFSALHPEYIRQYLEICRESHNSLNAQLKIKQWLDSNIRHPYYPIIIIEYYAFLKTCCCIIDDEFYKQLLLLFKGSNLEEKLIPAKIY